MGAKEQKSGGGRMGGEGEEGRFPSCLLFIRAFFNLIWRREGDKGETGAEDRRYREVGASIRGRGEGGGTQDPR